MEIIDIVHIFLYQGFEIQCVFCTLGMPPFGPTILQVLSIPSNCHS